MKKIIIAALTTDRVIGGDDGLPWSIPEEYEQYLSLVHGHTIIMGRKSWEIFGEDLKDTHNIVVSRSLSATRDYDVYPSVSQALAQAETLGRDIFIAGGSSIYEQTLHRVDYLYLSIIKEHHKGHSYFPLIDQEEWEVETCEDHPRFIFRSYRKRIFSN